MPPRRKFVLVLEDHASVGGLISALIGQDGYRIARAWNPQEAARLATGRKPDVVVVDANLPGPGGLGPLREIRGQAAVQQAPIVLVASGSVEITEEDRVDLADVVAKPFDIDVMLNAVRKALGDPVQEVTQHSYDAQDYFLNGY